MLLSFLREVTSANPSTFRVFGPDETPSNRLGAVLEHARAARPGRRGRRAGARRVPAPAAGRHRRAGAADGLGFPGVQLDVDRNAAARGDADIGAAAAPAATVVVTAREDREIARQVRALT